MINRLKWFFITVAVFKNWSEIYTRKFLYKETSGNWNLRLRSGVHFEVVDKGTILPVIVEVWHDRVYGDLSVIKNTPAPVVIDIGANIGSFSLLALQTNVHCTLFAYEPEPTNYSLLEKNIRSNGFSGRAKATQKAVGAIEGTVTLYQTGNNTGTNSLYVQSKKSVDVACTTLDAIFENNLISRCDFLKIDCEGAEYDILLNASAETLAKIGVIVLEWHSIAGHSLDELKSVLQQNGFSVSESVTHRLLTAVR